MSDVYRCDRCGAIVDRGEQRYVASFVKDDTFLVKMRKVLGIKVLESEYFDLCSGCYEDFKRWLGGCEDAE